jgi:pyruvate kinase
VVVSGGVLRSHKGINLPGVRISAPTISERDRRFIDWAVAEEVDFLGLSFVRRAEDVRELRALLRERGSAVHIVAKIEKPEAVAELEAIVDLADGVMVARGDLGVEMPLEQVPLLQKRIIRLCQERHRPVITATQMLESMTHSRRPTRAEATDVANAILDGTDCVMLSAESASGMYPVESVATLARIAEATEPHRSRFELWERLKTLPQEIHPGLYDLVSIAAEAVMEFGKAAAVVVPTEAGRTARSIARFRLPVWIAAATPSERVARQLHFSYGVHPELEPGPVADWNAFTREWVHSHGLAGAMAVLLRGPSADRPRANHAMELVDLGMPTSGERRRG